MAEKNKVLIFGGSFDPPHKQHIRILRDAIKKIRPDATLIVPTYLSPFKKKHLFSYLDRKLMIKKIIKSEKIKAFIYDFEYQRKKKTYTWMLVKKIKSIYPKAKLYFLLGSDSINQIKKWKKFSFLVKNLIFIIAKRKGHKLKISKKIKKIVLKKTYDNISSTILRKEIFSGDFKNIHRSIEKHVELTLKVKSTINKVKKIIEPHRYNHTIEVVKTAVHLAWIHGENLKKAFLAALLHDVAKNMSIKKQINLIKTEKLKIENLSYIIEKHPKILHQWASMVIAKKNFKIKDKKILSAISKHTTAAQKMTKLDKIIYVSDFISDDRNFKGVKKLRKIAEKDLKKAFKKIFEIKKGYAKKIYGEIYESK